MRGGGLLTASALALAGAFSGLQPARAQAPDVLVPISDCDVLAAHPSDRQRLADGVSDDQIIPMLAIPACRAAVSQNAGDARLQFQLGRALLAGRQNDESATAFQTAAEAGSAAAWAYLGDAYQLGNGRAIDYPKALEAYKRASTGGFEPASGLVDQMTFIPAMYAVSVLGQFYSRADGELIRLSKAEDTKWITRSYIFSLGQKLIADCRDVVRPSTVLALYTFRYGQPLPADGDPETSVSIYEAIGVHDADLFLRRHGCEGLIAKHLFQSIDLFIASFKE